MADGLNRVFLLGNLGADPELRFTREGTGVLNMRLATTESYLNKDKVRQERTDWHNVIVWGKRGEALGKFLTKGMTIMVEGSIRTSSYDDKEGVKRYKTEIVASNVCMAGGRREGGSAEHRSEARQDLRNPRGGAPTPDPRQQNMGGGFGGQPAHGDDFDGGFGGSNDDDIPFVTSRPNARGL